MLDGQCVGGDVYLDDILVLAEGFSIVLCTLDWFLLTLNKDCITIESNETKFFSSCFSYNAEINSDQPL